MLEHGRGKWLKGRMFKLIVAALPLDMTRLGDALRDLPGTLFRTVATSLGVEDVLKTLLQDTEIRPSAHGLDQTLALGGGPAIAPPPPTLYTPGPAPLVSVSLSHSRSAVTDPSAAPGLIR